MSGQPPAVPIPSGLPGRLPPFAKAAWGFLAYLLGVILFGAWVRITHSGDGCGSHWPTCGGEVIPASPSAATLIEYTHRLTSGFCGLLVLGLLVWAWRRYRAGPTTRLLALTSVFLLVEAGIGAGLVLGGLVGSDDSAARAIVIALHLVNTLGLTATAALAAWCSAEPGRAPRFRHRRAAFSVGAVLVLVTAMTGAVTALGDTLLPREVEIGAGLFARITDDLGPGNHFLARLRVLHPGVALLAAGYALWLLRRETARNRWARAARDAVLVECVVGFASVALAAPGWIQLLHLLVAQLFWIAFVLAWASSDAPAAAGDPALPAAAPSG